MNRTARSCQACRYNLLDAFASIAGVSLRPVPQYSIQRSSNLLPARTWNRTFGTSRYRSESVNTKPENKSISQEEQTPAPVSSDASIPWYLQVQTPSPPAPASRLQALEEIPPIPSDAPQILHPMLSHLSIQIGLDNLSLIDLRDVYPPPALGSNLIMILGTARSYKHLNTSADRFCRWLRSKYKLSPFADGLLGRNEMKLKLRRKARRMKLAQSVGNTVAMGSTEGGDDGITTGWICVNVGAVDGIEVGEQDALAEDGKSVSETEQEELDGDEEEYKNPPDDSGVVGFGTRDTRPRVVVQMFVEDKRLEMDLEGLWDVRVQRREKKEEKLDNQFGVKNR